MTFSVSRHISTFWNLDSSALRPDRKPSLLTILLDYHPIGLLHPALQCLPLTLLAIPGPLAPLHFLAQGYQSPTNALLTKEHRQEWLRILTSQPRRFPSFPPELVCAHCQQGGLEEGGRQEVGNVARQVRVDGPLSQPVSKDDVRRRKVLHTRCGKAW